GSFSRWLSGMLLMPMELLPSHAQLVAHLPAENEQDDLVLLHIVQDSSAWRQRSAAGSLLLLQQRSLAFHPPPVTRKAAVAADSAVARDHHGYRVRRAGPADRADCRGLAEIGRDLRIASRLAARDRLQRFPDAPLEGGRPEVEREFKRGLVAFQVAEYCACPASDLAGIRRDLGGGILVA